MDKFLDLRCEMALARVHLLVDEQEALAMAKEVFRKTVLEASDTQAPEPPWSIRNEPALMYAFEQGRAAGARARIANESLRSREAEASMRFAQRQQALAQARREFEAALPGPDKMLIELQGGGTLKLEQHSLHWDEECQALCGVNAYGLDYCWGAMTVESVTRWRSAMLRGTQLGCNPPEAYDPGPQDDGHAEPTQEEIDAWEAFDCLQHMGSVSFDANLNLQGTTHGPSHQFLP